MKVEERLVGRNPSSVTERIESALQEVAAGKAPRAGARQPMTDALASTPAPQTQSYHDRDVRQGGSGIPAAMRVAHGAVETLEERVRNKMAEVQAAEAQGQPSGVLVAELQDLTRQYAEAMGVVIRVRHIAADVDRDLARMIRSIR
jgi:hypothetical protein